MDALAKFFAWRDALVLVRPGTFVKWHRAALKMFWRGKSHKPSRPALPKSRENRSSRWLAKTQRGVKRGSRMSYQLKPGIRVSPRTIRKHLTRNPRGSSSQGWTTLVRNHAQAIVACDFYVSVTSSFRVLVADSALQRH